MVSSRIRTQKPASLRCPSKLHRKEDPLALENYLRDEAGAIAGKAEALFLPEDEFQVSMVLREADAGNVCITVSGSGTGLTGARVPLGGWVLATENLTSVVPLEGLEEVLHKNRETGRLYQIFLGEDRKTREPFAVAPAGISISDLREALENHGYMYPPDPTEATALLGATVATNASGSRTFRFGPTRNWIRRIRLVLPSGEVLDVRRGDTFASDNGEFEIENLAGETTIVHLPSYRFPPIKNAAGYFAEPGMDLVDLFIGSEGTLGVVTEVEVRLVPRLGELLSVVAFFPTIAAGLTFSMALRDLSRAKMRLDSKGSINVLSIEYFDQNSLTFLKRMHPRIPPQAKSAVFFEQENEDEAAQHLLTLMEEHGSMDSWATLSEAERAGFEEFRHSLPQAINELVRRLGTHKMGTDIAVPDEALQPMMDFYLQVGTETLLDRIYEKRGGDADEEAWKHLSVEEKVSHLSDIDPTTLPQSVWQRSGVKPQEFSSAVFTDRAEVLRTLADVTVSYVIFGHIGDNHLHFNFLAESQKELARVKEAYLRLAKKGVELGGTISGEHGVGKKTYGEDGKMKPYLELMYSQDELLQMARLKNDLDPRHMIGIGNIVPLKYLDQSFDREEQ